MKLLIDENLQPAYRRFFKSPDIEHVSVRFMNWQGKKNGELLRLMKANGFDAILTSDKVMYSNRQLEMHNLLLLQISQKLYLVISLAQTHLYNRTSLNKSL